LAAGLAASFFAGAAFLTGAFFAAVLALDVAVVPVTAFFAGARLLAVVVFLVAAALALGLPATTFLGAGFLAAAGLALAGAAFLGAAALVVAFAAALGLAVEALAALGLAAVALALEAGLFSLAAEDSAGLVFGASLTLPDGPLGRVNTPFSAPEVIAFESWVV